MSVVGLLLYLVPLLLFLCWHFTRHSAFFKAIDIPYEPAYPFVGSTAPFALRRLSFIEWISDLTQKFATHSAFGIVDLRGPKVVVQDPELIHQIAVKEFKCFTDHEPVFVNKADSLIVKSLFYMQGDEWADMRATLSPAFAENKVRMVLGLVNEVAEDFVGYFERRQKPDRKLIVDVKDIFVKYTIDVISSCAFGLTIHSLENPKNDIYVYGTEAFDFQSVLTHIKFIFTAKFPRLARFVNVGLTSAESKRFFINLVHDTIAHRRATNGFRPDMIQILMQAIDGKLSHAEDIFFHKNGFLVPEESEIGRKKVYRNWSDVELAAQCFLFFVVGYEDTSVTMLYTAYELAMNKDIQDKLIDEIDALHNEIEGQKLIYERLQKMEYMEAVICEALRKYPPGFILDRVCNAACSIKDSKGRQLNAEKGMRLWLNIYALHHNHEFFPNPEKYDPRRFIGENRQKIKPGTYLPFSCGPRSCLGSRFAMAEIKVLLYHLLSRFTLEICKQTPVPIKFSKGLSIRPETKIYLELRPRVK